jgi:monovalent cation:H+ antiporter-2, CPA2 family
VDNVSIALRIVQQARSLHGQLPILVRTRDDSQQSQLLAAGATEVVPEVLESSLMLASHALVLVGVPQLRVQQRMDSVRRSRYKLLHGYYHGGELDSLDEQGPVRLVMRAVNLSADAYACGLSLEALALEQLGLELPGVRRAGADIALTAPLLLCAGDALLLSGPLAAIEAGEALLLGGLR